MPVTGMGDVIDLSVHRNNAACAFPAVDLFGGLDGFGRSYPAEELGGLAELMGGLPEDWGRGADDNLECDGQEIVLADPVLAVGMGVLGACCGGSFRDEIQLVGSGGSDHGDRFTFALSDFLAVRPANGERLEVMCSTLREHGRDVPGPRPRLWTSSAEFPDAVEIAALRLPVNPSVHLFGAWTIPAGRR
ncbi:hypothetical protein ACIGPN_20635 [Streptomyces afghaniensis]|uniref:hypothetical protein n=1 Tax=Streptomyces TaxID=1883 RepID=UPI001FB02B27|nr:hypothetical protein [Streptomyces sp. HP-A2021]UOB12704.1 hypothetical protein MQE23_28250 [Streptomyces sp. HP-A2021]